MVTLDDKAICDILDRLKTMLKELSKANINSYTITIDSDMEYGASIDVVGMYNDSYVVTTMRN